MMLLRTLLFCLLPLSVLSRGLFQIDTSNVETGAFGGNERELESPPAPYRRVLRRTAAVRGAVPPMRPRRRRRRTQKRSKQRKLQTKADASVETASQQPSSTATDIIPADDGFDFIVAGFPKCGTTTLLKAFGAHPETDMAASEQCAIASPGQADAKVHKLLDATLKTLSPNLQRSFKCPTAMYNYKSLARMEKHSPKTKFVVGMRHPVKMLQSFYNYRISEIKERGLDEPIPSLQEVLASDTPWKGVSIQSTRFDLFLMQMGKTTVSPAQMSELAAQSYDLAIKPTNFTVFLYTVDQLEDTHVERSGSLRQVMQDYLQLRTPIDAFGHENQNHQKSAFAESISICDDKWAQVRSKLIEQGAKTAQWLRDEFIHSPDVIVANREHFVETLESWGVDPCVPLAAVAAEE